MAETARYPGKTSASMARGSPPMAELTPHPPAAFPRTSPYEKEHSPRRGWQRHHWPQHGPIPGGHRRVERAHQLPLAPGLRNHRHLPRAGLAAGKRGAGPARSASVGDARLAAYIERPTLAEQTATNAALLKNLVDGLEPVAPDLEHLTFIQGGKAYGSTLAYTRRRRWKPMPGTSRPTSTTTKRTTCAGPRPASAGAGRPCGPTSWWGWPSATP